jgi:hypothetical protein
MSAPTMVVDTREKRPYRFPGINDVVRKELNVGDYTHEGFEDTYAVERKSLDDLATSLGAERNRFENEIRRANGWANRNEDGNPIPGTKPDRALAEFVVVIEAPRYDVADWRNNDYCPNYYSNIHPNSVMGTVESWPDKYDTLRFEWAGSREEARQRTLALLDKWFLQHS